MFALLNPAALLTLVGLLVPVAIHLWNRRPGREVAVGSLRWLAAGANRRLRNLKPEQLWLLLLRAALLAVLAVATAGPVWRTALPTSQGVVLLSPEAAGLPALGALKPTIDSLRRRGYALRWLAGGFPRVSVRAWGSIGAGQAGAAGDSVAALATAPDQSFAWARVQQAAATFPDQPLFVVTSAALRSFKGSHAPLPAAVNWQALPDTTTAAWLQAAAMRGKRSDSLRLLVGRSTATQTTFRVTTLANHHDKDETFRVPGLPPLRLDTLANGGKTFELVPARSGVRPATPIIGGTPPQVVEIYANPEYAPDARYLVAALRAAATGLLNPPVLRRATKRPNVLGAHWTFWLSDEPLPPGWQQDMARQARRLWLEAAGPGAADTAHLATTEPAAAVAVFRRGSRPEMLAGETVWADGRGRAILARQALNQGKVYQLHTRLNPAWSELADDPQLPAHLLELLQPTPLYEAPLATTPLEKLLARYDQRQLDPAQLIALPKPARPSAGHISTGVHTRTFRTTDLRPWLVLLAGLLLLVERLLAHRRQAKAVIPNPA